MDTTPRLSLPYIAPSQAQKHVTHNEALRTLDMLVQLCLEGINAEMPPALPQNGQIWALGTVPLGEWAGQTHALAIWSENVWSFISPQPGWCAWDRQSEALRAWTGTSWNQIPTHLDSADRIGINTSADATNRLSVASAASLFNHDGSGHQVKINKATETTTASLLYQTGFSGRAEMGLSGNDDFSIKISPDGADWTTAVVVEKSRGHVGLGTVTPARTLHVSGAMRLEPSTAPSLPAEGDVYFDSATKKLRCHDGTQWNDLF